MYPYLTQQTLDVARNEAISYILIRTNSSELLLGAAQNGTRTERPGLQGRVASVVLLLGAHPAVGASMAWQGQVAHANANTGTVARNRIQINTTGTRTSIQPAPTT